MEGSPIASSGPGASRPSADDSRLAEDVQRARADLTEALRRGGDAFSAFREHGAPERVVKAIEDALIIPAQPSGPSASASASVPVRHGIRLDLDALRNSGFITVSASLTLPGVCEAINDLATAKRRERLGDSLATVRGISEVVFPQDSETANGALWPNIVDNVMEAWRNCPRTPVLAAS